MTMHSSQLSSSGSSQRIPAGTGCACLMNLIRLLVLGAQLESWLVTSTLAALICGSAFSRERAFSS